MGGKFPALPWLGLWVVSGATQFPSSLLGFLYSPPLLGIACFSGGWLGLCLSFDCCLHCLPDGWLFQCGLVSHGPAGLAFTRASKATGKKTWLKSSNFGLSPLV